MPFDNLPSERCALQCPRSQAVTQSIDVRKAQLDSPSWASMLNMTGLLAIVEGIAIDVFFATHSVRLALVEREVEREDTLNALW